MKRQCHNTEQHCGREHLLRLILCRISTDDESPLFDEKRRILMGRDFLVYRYDDLLEGIPDERIES